jgi:hypothetical protein
MIGGMLPLPSSLPPITPPNRVVLIACSKNKLPTTAAARDLYTGQLFRLSLAYAEPRAEHVFVVSAMYGALALDDRVAPYNLTMKNIPRPARQGWAARTLATLFLQTGMPTSLELLVSKAYAAPLRPILADLVSGTRGFPEPSYPLQGLGIGERKRWLAERITSGPAARAGRPASSGPTRAPG